MRITGPPLEQLRKGPSMSTPNLTVPDSEWARYPVQKVATIANRMETLAERLRRNAQNFENPNVPAASVLGEIVSDLTQGIGNLGTYLSDLVHDVEQLRAARERQAVSQ